MNTNVSATEVDRSKISAEEWTARIELATVHRLLNHYGWDEFIYHHAAARVPGEPDMFLMKRQEHLYTEVTASSLVKISMHAPIGAKLGVSAPGFVLHSGVMKARSDVNYSIHIHTPKSGAIAALPSGLRMISQSALRFHGRIAYYEFEGITDSETERDHIVRDLADKSVLLMRYHGVLVVGHHCALTFGTLRHFMTACEIQLMAEATGQPLMDIDPSVSETTAKQVEDGERRRGNADMPAYLRLADQSDPGYRG